MSCREPRGSEGLQGKFLQTWKLRFCQGALLESQELQGRLSSMQSSHLLENRRLVARAGLKPMGMNAGLGRELSNGGRSANGEADLSNREMQGSWARERKFLSRTRGFQELLQAERVTEMQGVGGWVEKCACMWGNAEMKAHTHWGSWGEVWVI